MPYTKLNWSNSPATTTPLSAANLNNLETQYDQAVADCVNVNGDTMTGTLTINTGAVAVALTVATAGWNGIPVALMRSGMTGADDMLIRFERYNSSVNMKNWEIAINHATWRFRGSNDAYSLSYDWLTAYRVAGSHNIEHVDINATSYVGIAAPNFFVNNLYVQAGYVRNRTSAPIYELWSDNSAGNHQRWQWHASANVMGLRAINDAGGAGGHDIIFTRSGEQITSTQFRRDGVAFFTINHATGTVSHGGVYEPSIIRLRGYQPHIRWFDTSAGAENKGWDIYNLSTTLSIRTVNDNENSHGPYRVDFMRSGNVMTRMAFYGSIGEFARFDLSTSKMVLTGESGPSIVSSLNANTGFGIANSGAYAVMYGDGLFGVIAHRTGGAAQATVSDRFGFGTYEPTGSAAGARVARKAVYTQGGALIGYLSITSS